MKKLGMVLFLAIPFFFLGCAGGGGGDSPSTSTPASTPAPATPVATTPVVSQPKLELSGSLYETVDFSGDLKIFGEVKNNGNATVPFIQAKFVFFDSSSNMIGQESSFIEGTVLRLSALNINTNTGLKPSEKGVFQIWTSLKRAAVSMYTYSFTYTNAETADPAAKLEIVGTVNAQRDIFSDLEYLGQVKNTGTKGLTFGEVFFVTRDGTGAILDIDSSFINGETITISIGTTDTALNIGSQGTFKVSTTVPFSSYASYEAKFDWNDADIQAGIAKEFDGVFEQVEILSKRDWLIMHNQKAEKLRDLSTR